MGEQRQLQRPELHVGVTPVAPIGLVGDLRAGLPETRPCHRGSCTLTARFATPVIVTAADRIAAEQGWLGREPVR